MCNKHKSIETETEIQYSININDLHVGDMLLPDNGFTCLPHNEPVKVIWHEELQTLCVWCTGGIHTLDGNFDPETNLIIGFKKLIQ